MFYNETESGGTDMEYVVLFSGKHEKKESVPVLVVSGWGAPSLDQYKKPLLFLSEKRDVIGANTSSKTSHEPIILKKEYRYLLGQFSYYHVRKALALMSVLKKNKIIRTDVVAYSEGAIIVTIAASFEPSLFRNIIFVNPAGITPPRHPINFLGSYLKETLLGVKEAFSRKIFWKKVDRVCEGPIRRFLSHPFRSFMEMSDIAQADIRGNLYLLKSYGIQFSLLLAKDDQIFPLKKAKRFAPKDIFREIKESEGRHSNFIFEEMRVLLAMFSVLEKK